MAATAYGKLIVGLILLAVILASARAPAPGRAIPGGELRRLVAAALLLYAAGTAAFLTHHATLAGLVCACGIAVCTLAAWLSRGIDPDWPPPGKSPAAAPPPPPDDLPEPDWEALERALRDAAEHEPTGVA